MTPDREKELQARITNAATLYALECETSDALRAEIALMRATIEELRKALVLRNGGCRCSA